MNQFTQLSIGLLLGFIFSAAVQANECGVAQDRCDDSLRHRLTVCSGDYSDPDAQARCKRAAVHEWGICWQQADFACDEEGPPDGTYLTEEDCGIGRPRNLLGLCGIYFDVPELAPGIGGCPPGQEPGDDDRCVPSFQVKTVPHQDGYYIACPRGMRPSLVGGDCEFDETGTTPDGSAGDNDGVACPPGSEYDLGDNDCHLYLGGPSIDQSLDLILHTLQRVKHYERETLPVESLNELNERIMFSHAIEAVVEGVSTRLGVGPTDID